MKERLLYLLLPIVSLVLEILPYGAVCNFANPEGEPWRKTFSYFDLTPFGYANFAPFLTAILTCVILLLLVLFCIKGSRRMAIVARDLLYAAVIISLGPLVFGIKYYSLIGALITISLAAELLLLQTVIKQEPLSHSTRK